MARNPAHTLTDSDLATVSANRVLLSNRIGQTVTLDFTTRAGEARTYTGEIVSLTGTRTGRDSTEAVTFLTDKGERSANLWLIKAIV